MKLAPTPVRLTVTSSLLLAAVAALAGCGVTDVSAPISALSGQALNGRIVGGQQPVQNASIFLYAAGTTGNGTGATNLLNKPVVTAADGSFSLVGDVNSCPSSTTQIYLVASGGNPGISSTTNNTALLMMAALGDCAGLGSSSYIYVNEVTTAAAAWALAQFLGPNAVVGASATNATGLRNAFLVANNLANTTTGAAGGASLPAGASVELAKLNTLANVLSVCVNSGGGSSCGPLFAAATEAGVTPTNTLDAALAIVRNPGSNVAAVFSAITTATPFQGGLTGAPSDWTMSVTYTGGGIYSPTAVALDSTGSIWVANYFGGVASKLSAAGVPAAAGGFADPVLHESYGLAVDTQDSAWITNEELAGTNYNGSISKFNSSGVLLSGSGIVGGGIYYPYAIAADSNGHMWVADEGRSGASLLANDGTSLLGSTGVVSTSLLPFPIGVALDASHNAWFSGGVAATMVTPGGAVTMNSCCRSASGVAIDRNGAVWLSDYAGSAVVQISPSGTMLQTLTGVGGIHNPESVAIDGAGSVWVANYHGQTVSAFANAVGGAVSAALSPARGFGLDAMMASPFGIALDASGNVWVADFAGNEVTQLVGLAAPIRTPLMGPAVAP